MPLGVLQFVIYSADLAFPKRAQEEGGKVATGVSFDFADVTAEKVNCLQLP